MPAVDLSKIHKGLPDVVVDVKPLISFNHDKLLTADQVQGIKPAKDVRWGCCMWIPVMCGGLRAEHEVF